MQMENVFFACVIFCSIIRQAYFYTEFLLESDKLCSILFSKKTIKLGYENKSGIIVRQDMLFKSLTGKYPFDCVFTVEGGSAGVVAVIQQMKFRTGETEDHNTTCIDYVQFANGDKNFFSSMNVQFSNSRRWSEKYCGDVDISDSLTNIAPSDGQMKHVAHGAWELGQNTFLELNGFLDVKIHIGAQPFSKPDELEFVMAVTSFQECKYDMGSYKMCGGQMCVWREYLKDGIVNCPFLECSDENVCGEEPTAGSKGLASGLGTKVLLGAMAGILTMIFVLILFFWTFHYCGFLCGPKPPHNLTELSAVPAGPDEPGRRVPTCMTPLSPAHTEEKDLPPAYETLFPAECAPAR